MFGRKITIKRGGRDEAEKPFWISFADLMTALMVLFLVASIVATKSAQEKEAEARRDQAAAVESEKQANEAKLKADDARKEAEVALEKLKKTDINNARLKDISDCHDQLEDLVKRVNGGIDQGIRLDRAGSSIDFGSRAKFEEGSYNLTADQAVVLRQFVLELLSLLRTQEHTCSTWLKKFIVDGFTNRRGTYLNNLNLSLNRSQRVMCVLLSGEYATVKATPPVTSFGTATPSSFAGRPILKAIAPVAPEDDLMIRQLFRIGGYSSNDLKPSPEESRRIELRIEFYEVDEVISDPLPVDGTIGRCAAGG